MSKQGLYRVLGAVAVCGLLLAGMFVVSASPWRDPPPNLGADYIGSKRCASCHNNSGAELWDAWLTTAHAAAVQDGTHQTVQGNLADTAAVSIEWPDGITRPVTLEDITYVISGRRIQQYVSVQEDDAGETHYYVLPLVWNLPQSGVELGFWSEGPVADWAAPENDWRQTCAGCHTTGLTADALESGPRFAFVDDWNEGDVELGVGCESCHGPAGDHNGGREPMPRLADAEVCGQCHVQGLAADGLHPYPLDYQPGLDLGDSLTLAAADDPAVWWSSGHARATNTQYNEWSLSAHATALDTLLSSDLAEDACLRCHGPALDTTDPTPDLELTLDTATNGVTCVVCHNPHPAESQPRAPLDLSGSGADDYHIFPPEEPKSDNPLLKNPTLAQVIMTWQGQGPDLLLQTDTYTLCTSCHNSQTVTGDTMRVDDTLHHPVQEMYEGRAVVDALPGIPSTHFSEAEGPRCVTCHMVGTVQVGATASGASHRFAPVLPGVADEMEPDSCTTCHTDYVTRDTMQQTITAIQESVLNRTTAVQDAAGADAPDWIADAVAFIDGDGSLGIHNYAYTDALLDAAERELSIVPEVEPLPDILLPDAVIEATAEAPTLPQSDVVPTGLGIGGVLFLLLCTVVVLGAAYAFFIREGRA